MKISKPVLIAGALTLMFIFFAFGYFTADAGRQGFTVSAQRGAEAVYVPPAEDTESDAPADNGEKINISTATRDELMTLPGIGEAMAGRIIEFREENGAFEIIEDITLVKGIGQKTFDNIRNYITTD